MVGAPLAGNTSHLSPKGGKTRQESSGSGKIPERKKTRSSLMYRLRDMDLDDKVCEQVEMTMLSTVYPKEVITRCVQDSQPWSSKARRVRQSTAVALVLFVIGMALWSRLNQCQVWHKLVGKLWEVHGADRLVEQVGRGLRVMTDGGTSWGGFFEHVRKLGAHALGVLEAGAWEHRAKQRRFCDGSVLAWVPPTRTVCYPMQQGMWVRIISYRVTDERLGEVGKVYRLVTTLLNPRVAPAMALVALYHQRWEVELVIDEIKTHERVQRKVLRSKTPEGVYQELYGIFLAHYAVRALMAQAAMEGNLDPDRLSFTEGLFHLTEMIDLALTLEPEEATEPLLNRFPHKMPPTVLPPRRLRSGSVASSG